MDIYIDESGNLGTQGRHFTIACVVAHNQKRLENLAKHSRVKFGNPTPIRELKGSQMTFDQRQKFLNNLTSSRDFEFAYIVADKKHLYPSILRDKNVCYNYLVGHLLKGVVKPASDNVNVICDNRNIKITSHQTLEGYIRTMAYTKWGFGHTLNLQYGDSEFMDMLQVADIISNTIHGRYELKKGHFYRQIKAHLMHGIRFPYATFGS